MKRSSRRLFRDWTEGRRSPGLFCFAALARPASWLYRAAMIIDQGRRRIFPPLSRASLIVVSSPLVGGTGKTPLAAHLARRLQERGLTPGLVTKGYGRRAHGTFVVDESGSEPPVAAVGDEALMLWRETRIPVHVGDEPADVIARLDEAGRHRAIIFDDGVSRRWQGERRIVVLSPRDCTSPVRYLPFGRWRVRPQTVAQATYVAIVSATVCDDAMCERHRLALRGWGFTGPVAWYRTQSAGFARVGSEDVREAETVPSGPPYVFCGLGAPSRFLEHLEAYGVTPAGVMCYPDHHAYTRDDLADLVQSCRRSRSDWLLTTHKDAVKIDPSWTSDIPVYVLRLTLDLIAGDDLADVVATGAENS